MARTIAACGSGYTDRVHRTIGLPPCSRCRACEAAIDREAGAALGRAGGPATSVARTIAACGSGYTDRVELLGYPPVAAAEHREAAIDRAAGAALGGAEGPATIAACGSGYTDRVHRTIGSFPCSRCRAPRGCDRPRSGRRSWGRRRSCDQRGPDHRSLRQRLQRFSRALRARSRRRAGCGSVCFRTGRRSWPAGGGSRLPPHWCRSRSSCPTRTR